MAIAYDASSQSTVATWSHTCTGTNLILFVHVRSGAGNVASMTYNGVAMTYSGLTSLGGEMFTWYLYAPSTGANNIIVVGGGSQFMATSYSGASQTGFPDNSTVDGAVALTLTDSVTPVASNCWFIGIGSTKRTSGTTTSCTTDRTSRDSLIQTLFGGRTWDSNGTVAVSSQSQTVTTNSGGANIAVANIMFTLAPAAAATGFNTKLLLMGVGK